MATLFSTGFEIRTNSASDSLFTDGVIGGGTVTTETTIVNGGTASRKYDSTGANAAAHSYVQYESAGSPALDVTCFARFYARFSAIPTSTVVLACFDSITAARAVVRITSAGKLQLYNVTGAAQIGSDSSATIVTGQWYRIELAQKISTGAADYAELRLDGTTVATATGLSLSDTTFNDFTTGMMTAPGANVAMYVDDLVINDDTGASNNSWPGDGKVLLMKPTSDSQRGSWTGGVGGTTNLWDAVNNTPPVGTATETDASQIESADSSGDNATDEYRGNCGSYTTAGVPSGATVNSIRVLCNHGEDIATNTKTGSVGCQANPATTYVAFTFGDDGGLLGTYPSGWSWGPSSGNIFTVAQAPSVTLGSSLILGLRKTDTGTRVGSVDFLGAYVAYTPAGGSTYTKAGYAKEHG